MNTTIGFVKSFEDVMAKGQQFFVLSQRHGSVSPFDGFRPFTTVPARPPVYKSGILRRTDKLERSSSIGGREPSL
jgi:hypothetical protein